MKTTNKYYQQKEDDSHVYVLDEKYPAYDDNFNEKIVNNFYEPLENVSGPGNISVKDICP